MTSREFAANAHAEQGDLYGGEPYVIHLDEVVRILAFFGFVSQIYIDAGFCHDTIEDTVVTYEELQKRYGTMVANIVYACSGFGPNRRARMADILEKVCDFMEAAIVKAADRIANVENARATNRGLFLMYVKEKDAFIEAVGRHLPDAMLARLIAAHEDE